MKLCSVFMLDEGVNALARYSEDNLEYMKRDAAFRLSKAIMEANPWVESRIERFGPQRCFKSEFVVLSLKEWQTLGEAIRHICLDLVVGRYSPDRGVKEIQQAIEYYLSPNIEI